MAGKLTSTIHSTIQELKVSRDALDLELMSAKKCCMEEDRLLCVAMTRAREYLVLPYFKKSSGACIKSPDRISPSGLFSAAHFKELRVVASCTIKKHVLSGITLTVEAIPSYDSQIEETSNKNEEVWYYNVGEKQQGMEHPKRFIAPSAAEKITRGIRLKILDFQRSYLSLNQVPVHLQATVWQLVHHGFASWQPDAQALKEVCGYRN